MRWINEINGWDECNYVNGWDEWMDEIDEFDEWMW